MPPQAEDVRAVILRAGDVVVLNRGIWHDACRGLGRPSAYYYLASCDQGKPGHVVFIPVGDAVYDLIPVMEHIVVKTVFSKIKI